MDRSWMKASRINDEYENEVEQFFKFVERNASFMGGKFFCPCVKCGNGRCQSLNDIRSHLICDRIILNYTKWIRYGELPDMSIVSHTEPIDVDIRDCIECFQQAHAPFYEKLQSDSKKPLYLRCTTFTRLLVVLALVNLKARFGWSNKSFTELLVALKKMLLEDNT